MQRPAWNTPSMSLGALSAMKALHACSICSALKIASSTALTADALRETAAATVYRASKNIVSSQTHTRASMTAVNVSQFDAEADVLDRQQSRRRFGQGGTTGLALRLDHLAAARAAKAQPGDRIMTPACCTAYCKLLARSGHAAA